MTLTATPDNISLHVAAHAASAPAATRGAATRSLSEAVQAVNDHRREVELRRMAAQQQQSASGADWAVPVPRSQLQALEQQARDAAVLRALLDSGPVIAVPFSSLPPYTLRSMPLALARTLDEDAGDAQHDRPLTRLFAAPDVARLQQALFDGEAASLVAHLRRSDGQAVRSSVHLSAADPADPDWRWACIVALPQRTAAAQTTERHLPPKSNQRPRLDVRPAPAA
jgi:hypothetical protein